MSWGAVAKVVVLAAVLGGVTTGTAAAAEPPLANAAFVAAGVQVYPLAEVGPQCQVLGSCDGVAAELAESAVPRYLSSRSGEAVFVECRSADVAKVQGFFGSDRKPTLGWANAAQLQLRSPVRMCGLLG